MSLESERKDYIKGRLNETEVPANPIQLLQEWLDGAKEVCGSDYNAMTVSTIDQEAFPSIRIVLLRELTSSELLFYTNYTSQKGTEIEADPKVGVNFFWKELERQVRLTGLAKKVSAEQSDKYFNSRPRASQIGAWASDQSAVLATRTDLEERVEYYTKTFEGKEVPRPEFWGGFAIVPVKIEFWQGRSSRLHDRLEYRKEGEGNWKLQRLNP